MNEVLDPEIVEDDEEQLMPDSHSSENDETKDETEVENEM